ncbi:hypothetical protein Tco_1225052 [Tanacetum coccineum]
MSRVTWKLMGVVIVDEPMKGEVKNKSEVIVDVSNGNFVVRDTLFEGKKTQPWWRDKQERNKTCPWGFDKQRVGNIEGDGVSTTELMGCGDCWKECEKSSEKEIEIMKDSTDQTDWSSELKVPKLKLTGLDYVSHPKLTDTILKDEDMESIGVISNNFKGIWEDSEKMIIILIHMVSGVKRGLSDSKEKGLSNLKCFIQSKGVTRSISDFDGMYLFMSCKDANKNGVNICDWELSGCKWRGKKKTCGIYCQVRNNKWKFDIWRWPKRKKKVGGM